MPYVKKAEVRNAAFSRLITGYGLNAPKLAKVLGCSVPTARKKLTGESDYSFTDFHRINRFGHIPIEELREAITK